MVYGSSYIQNNELKLTLESFLMDYDYFNIYTEEYSVVKESVSDLKGKISKFFKDIIEKIKKFFKIIFDKAKGLFNKAKMKITKDNTVPKDYIIKTVTDFSDEEINKIYYNGAGEFYYNHKLFGFDEKLSIISSTNVVNQIQEYVYANIDTARTDQGMFNLYSEICNKLFANFDKSLFSGFTKEEWDNCMINNKAYPSLDSVKFKNALNNMPSDVGFDSKKFILENIIEYISNSNFQQKAMGGLQKEYDDIMKMVNGLKDANEKMYQAQAKKFMGVESDTIRAYSIFQAFSYTSSVLFNIYAVAVEYLTKSMALTTRIMARSYGVVCTKYIGNSNVDIGIEQADKAVNVM